MLDIILGTIVLTINVLFVNSAIDKDIQPVSTEVLWIDDISNPYNEEFIVEVAFNLDIDVSSVTQDQFNDRYLKSSNIELAKAQARADEEEITGEYVKQYDVKWDNEAKAAYDQEILKITEEVEEYEAEKPTREEKYLLKQHEKAKANVKKWKEASNGKTEYVGRIMFK